MLIKVLISFVDLARATKAVCRMLRAYGIYASRTGRGPVVYKFYIFSSLDWIV